MNPQAGGQTSSGRRRARAFGVAILVVGTLLLAGCTSQGSSSDSGTGMPGVRDGTGVEPGVVPEQSGGSAPDEAPGTTGDVKNTDRDVITTGSVSITVNNPIQAAADAVTITEQAGGRVDSRTENPGTDAQPASATLSLRIPSDELDRTLTELKKLGTVNFVSLNDSDVTAQSADLDARILALQTSVDRLLALMATATNTTDLIAIESTLSTRQSDLESYQSQRDYLADQIDFSTIGLELYATGVFAPGSPDDFWSGIAAGWNGLVTALGGALVALGVALPWLGVFVVLGLIAWLIVWLSTRKRKAA